RVGIGVWRPARTVVQVVELANARDPGQRHLTVGRAGQPEVEVGVEPGRQLVHRLAPGPEVAPARLGAPAKGPLEGMGVRVGEPRNRDPVQARRARRRVGHSRGHARDPLTVDVDGHSLVDRLTAEPGKLAPVRARAGAHGPYRSTIPRARSSKAARWWRS